MRLPRASCASPVPTGNHKDRKHRTALRGSAARRPYPISGTGPAPRSDRAPAGGHGGGCGRPYAERCRARPGRSELSGPGPDQNRRQPRLRCSVRSVAGGCERIARRCRRRRGRCRCHLLGRDRGRGAHRRGVVGAGGMGVGESQHHQQQDHTTHHRAEDGKDRRRRGAVIAVEVRIAVAPRAGAAAARAHRPRRST